MSKSSVSWLRHTTLDEVSAHLALQWDRRQILHHLERISPPLLFELRTNSDYREAIEKSVAVVLLTKARRDSLAVLAMTPPLLYDKHGKLVQLMELDARQLKSPLFHGEFTYVRSALAIPMLTVLVPEMVTAT